jgi:hypothetical protein
LLFVLLIQTTTITHSSPNRSIKKNRKVYRCRRKRRILLLRYHHRRRLATPCKVSFTQGLRSSGWKGICFFANTRITLVSVSKASSSPLQTLL